VRPRATLSNPKERYPLRPPPPPPLSQTYLQPCNQSVACRKGFIIAKGQKCCVTKSTSSHINITPSLCSFWDINYNLENEALYMIMCVCKLIK